MLVCSPDDVSKQTVEALAYVPTSKDSGFVWCGLGSGVIQVPFIPFVVLASLLAVLIDIVVHACSYVRGSAVHTGCASQMYPCSLLRGG